ncbi:MAG: peptidoglycan-binding protein, partial [Silicimonas sp.]|nr:peptidoglycan-binding protein [Silicimonas sp.]
MQSVQSIASEIIAREGGYVNDPDDPGGATNYGVTIHTMRRLGLDLTGDGKVTTADVRKLTRAQAQKIFIDHYFHHPRISHLPKVLQATVFDMQVNAGTHAVKILQRLTTKMGFPARADGQIGPKTRDAARQAALAAPDHIADAYGIARRNYYYALADRRPASRKYARRRDGGKGGWITRAEDFISPRYHLSDAAH